MKQFFLSKRVSIFVNGIEFGFTSFEVLPFLTIIKDGISVSISTGWLFWEIGIEFLKRDY